MHKSARREVSAQTAIERTPDGQPWRPGDELDKEALLISAVADEDLKEKLDGLRVGRVAVVESTALQQILDGPRLMQAAAEQLLQL